MRQVWFLALCALFVALPTALAAQTIPSPFRHIETRHSLGLFAGYLVVEPGDYELQPESAPLVGVRYGLQLSGPLVSEVSVALSPSERTVFVRPLATDSTLEPIARASSLLLVAEGGFRFRLTGPRTWRGLAPHLGGTIGVAVDAAKRPEIDAQVAGDQRYRFGPAFAASAGVGTEFFATERFSLQADFKDHFWRLSHPIGLTGTTTTERQWVHNFSISIGGSIHF